MKPTVGLTTGCPAGVGPEVAAAAISALQPTGVELVYFGHPGMLAAGARTCGLNARVDGNLCRLRGVDVRCEGGSLYGGQAGHPDAQALQIQRDSLMQAIDAAEKREVQALWTAPIRKASLEAMEGRSWPGHTELLGARLGEGPERVTMVFAGGPFLLALCTVHIPLREVSAAVTPARLHRSLGHLADLAQALSVDSEGEGDALAAPRQPSPPSSAQERGEGDNVLVVLGLNPHAGEGGLVGTEEREVIEPAMTAWSREGFVLRGPVPADGFFAEVGRGAPSPTGVLAMAHDQGLAPYKLLTGGAGVNLTAGLSVFRASPDHGTADAIAGRGQADPASAAAALAYAVRAARRASDST